MKKCLLDGQPYPGEGFEEDPEHGWVHRTEHPHTVLGEYLDEGGFEPADAEEHEGNA